MNNTEIVKKYYEIVSPNGTNISKRHTESYWRKHDHGDLYDLILQKTSFLDLSKTTHLSERITALKANITEHPSCITCGKPVMFIERSSFSEFCSKECSSKDPLLSQKRKHACSKVNKESANEKRRSTMLERYGVPYNSQRDDVKSILSESKLKCKNPAALEKLQSFEWMHENYIIKQRSLVDIAKELDVYYGTVGDYCTRVHKFVVRQRTNYSLHENEIGEFINSIGFSWYSDRSILEGYEIDLYIDSMKFGIELDGVYWHSYNRFETKEEKHKHLSKTTKAIEKGVKLFHVFDSEWIEKRLIVESMIKAKLGLNSKINARKCIIDLVDKKETCTFLNENHIQGYVNSKLNLGLFYNNELVMIMTFGSPRFNKKYDWELIRLASKRGVTVVGGSSKLFSHFKKTTTIEKGVICYSDRRFGEGDVYLNLGFTKMQPTGPGYYWTDGNVVWSRTRFQKNKLNKLLVDFDPSKSEAENMFDNNYRRLWDCGVNVYSYK